MRCIAVISSGRGDFDADEVVAHVDGVANFGVKLFDDTGPGTGDFDQGFRGFNFSDHLVDGHSVAGFDHPVSDVCFGEPFAYIGQGKDLHVVSLRGGLVGECLVDGVQDPIHRGEVILF